MRAVSNETRQEPGEEVTYSVLGFDKVWFTRHAIKRMKQRKVSRKEVFSVLEKPTQKGLRTQPGRHRWRKHRTSRLAVDVVFEKWDDKLCIVTVIVIQDML
jgi:hypothetical protein